MAPCSHIAVACAHRGEGAIGEGVDARRRGRVPDAEIAALREVRFSTAMRGYDREAVDQYVSRVNQVLAELQITAAPESAIRHALEQVTEETKGLLERAHETADEITRRSRSQADDRIQGATQEAQQLHDASEQGGPPAACRRRP